MLDGEVVLSPHAEDTWGDGAPSLEREAEEVLMGRPVALDRVPTEDAAWVGRSVRLFDKKKVPPARASSIAFASSLAASGRHE